MTDLRVKKNPLGYARAALAAAAILAATSPSCSPRRPDAPRDGKSPSRDTFVQALLGDASYLNPVLASDSASGAVNALVFNGLIKYDRDLNIVGDLAESWTISGDGRTIIFRLKKNVRWHDGAPFTSADVKFTHEKLADPRTKTPYASDYLLVESLRTPDPHTVQVRYKKPFAPALESWGMGIIPKHIFEGRDINTHPANRSPMGTGAFKFLDWKSDERIVLAAFDECFEGAPGIGRVIFNIVPDQSVQFLELRNDSVDYMGLTPDQYNAYDVFFRRHDKFRYPAFQYTYMGFNLERPPFNDIRVRRAIAHAIDKSQIIDGVLLGMGRAATGPFPPQSWSYNPAVKDFEYNPAKAKDLLREAGWTDSDGDGVLDRVAAENGPGTRRNLEFTILTNQGNKIRAMTAEIIQAQLAAAGIKADIRIVEWSAFIHQFINKKNFDAVILGWSLSRDPDQYSIWHSAETGEGKYNFVSYKNPITDRLLERGRSVFDKNERRRIYQKLHEIIHSDAAYIFLYYPDALPVVHKRFEGPETAPAGLGWNFIKWRAADGKIKYASGE